MAPTPLSGKNIIFVLGKWVFQHYFYQLFNKMSVNTELNIGYYKNKTEFSSSSDIFSSNWHEEIGVYVIMVDDVIVGVCLNSLLMVFVQEGQVVAREHNVRASLRSMDSVICLPVIYYGKKSNLDLKERKIWKKSWKKEIWFLW